MPPHAGCTILGTEKDSEGNEWYKIKSDKVTGYVDKQYITAGDEALSLVPQVGRLVVKVDCDVLNVRTKASTKSEVLYQISQGEELDIISISKEWIEVSVDVGQDNAFVAREFVKVSFELQILHFIKSAPNLYYFYEKIYRQLLPVHDFQFVI